MSKTLVQEMFAVYGDKFYVDCPKCKHKTHFDSTAKYNHYTPTPDKPAKHTVFCWHCYKALVTIHIAPEIAGKNDSA